LNQKGGFGRLFATSQPIFQQAFCVSVTSSMVTSAYEVKNSPQRQPASVISVFRF